MNSRIYPFPSNFNEINFLEKILYFPRNIQPYLIPFPEERNISVEYLIRKKSAKPTYTLFKGNLEENNYRTHEGRIYSKNE